MRNEISILFAFSLLLVSGCTSVHYGIFISTMSEDITLEVRQLDSSKCFESPERYTQTQGERKVYYLVTRDGVYPIPVKWRESWKAHKSDIVAGFDLTAARKRLVKEGLLKE